ncbi:MAG: NTF2 fold immunity protein [Roseiarcus sp.]
MTTSDSDGQASSMWLHRSLGTKLISAGIATEIARLVTRERYGQLEVDRNEPLKVDAAGDTWIVSGSNNEDFNVKHPRQPAWGGPLRMQISQFDGQILEYVFDIDWSKTGPTDT